MSQIRFLIDEDAQHRGLLAALRARGVDVVAAADVGLGGVDDDAVLTQAANSGRALYTFNVGDFCHLHAKFMSQHRSHAGIVIVPRQRYTVGQQVRSLFQLINMRTAEDMRDRLEFL